MLPSDDIRAEAEAWLAQDPDPDTRAELQALLDAGDGQTLAERFGGRLTFGTAGIRGTLGAGPLRMNRVVVRQVTAGLAAQLELSVDEAVSRGVVVGYDGRRKSRDFAEDAARVLLGAGFKVYLTDGTAPTPLVAFATKHLNAAAGVVVTASHNPPEYNGYKVYWASGAQIGAPNDAGVARQAEAIERVDTLPLGDLDAARAEGRLELLGDDLRARYLDGVLGLRVHPEIPPEVNLTLAYTPLHGVGAPLAEEALKRAGHTVHTVAEQREPDGTFPTVRFPNPEEPGALDLLLELARKVDADLAIANDPDADRLSIAIPVDGDWRPLTGDQIGALLAYYLLTQGPDDPDRLLVTTLVSSGLLGVMAEDMGVRYLETLTGFKWIINGAIAEERAHGARPVLGYEEALGYSIGTLVRDKDGIGAATVFAELAAWCKQQGRTVASLLEEIYRRYGLFATTQRSVVFQGADAQARMQKLMQEYRQDPPRSFGETAVREVEDLLKEGGRLPSSNVLIFRLEGDARFIMRPSGTEPKVKSYYELREPLGPDEPYEEARRRAQVRLAALADAHQATLK